MLRIPLTIALITLTAAANAEPPYATRGDGQIWMNGFGQCWRSGTWTAEQGVYPCDGNPPALVTPRAAEPVAAPAPVVVQAPAPTPVPQRETIALSSDLLFEFNSATLKESGKQKLDQLTDRLQRAEHVTIVGYADRLGSPQYNQKLSEKRAQTVRDYLAKSANAQAIKTAGKGSADPVTGDSCKSQRSRRQLIECLQPDRRVHLEISGPRSLAGADSGASSGDVRPVSNR